MYQQSEKTGRLISELDSSERPREKAMQHGFDSLTDAELMAIIFATGVKGVSVVDLCHQILEKNLNHLSLVTKKSVKELCDEHKGIGPVKAITLLAALELGRRAGEDAARLAQKRPLLSSTDVYDFVKGKFLWLTHEEFWMVYFNRSGHVVRVEKISQGGTFNTVVDVTIVIKHAIMSQATSMILCHNHPSGTLKPSIDDDRLTKRITDAARLFDIRVNDHLIITDGGYYSYADHGKI